MPFRQDRRRLAAAAVILAALFAPGAAHATVPAGNLVLNPGGDDGPGATGTDRIDPPNWGGFGGLTAVQYGAAAFPVAFAGASAPNFLAGGPGDDAFSGGEQTIPLDASAAEINAGRVTATLSAHLGGLDVDQDTAEVKAEFRNESGDMTFLMLQIGPVTVGDRNNATVLLPRSASGVVPPDTQNVRVTLTMTLEDGMYNDGYADNVSLVLETEAKGDAATVSEDVLPIAVDVLANDSDVNNVPRQVASVTQPANGAVTITGGGSGLSYSPNANYCNSQTGGSPDTFTYTLNSGGSATVAMTVTCVDDPPVAVNDTTSVGAGSGPTALDLLANDTDPDGGAKQIVAVTQAVHGTVAIASDGSGVTYMPNSGYCDSLTRDAFTYTLNGGSIGSVTVSVPCPTFLSPCPANITSASNFNGTSGPDRLVGTPGADTLSGLGGDDCLSGGAGNDRLDGGTDDDLLFGEPGTDRLSGGSGRDRLLGGTGNDNLAGESGDDRLRGDSGSDRLNGGSGGDTATGGAGTDSLSGGSGSDTLSGSAGADRLIGGSGRDRFRGGAGADRISARDRNRERIDCGSGRDRVTADRNDRVSRNCERVSRG